ncbi:AAA family ATPase [Candidatus Parcubacteria bacterium]|nr:MAG: AAA family ATPase [Candidatus Parcubacteria bacterium]
MPNNVSQNFQKKYIVCPVCNGEGTNKEGKTCPNCGGMAVGTFYFWQFFYWGPRLGLAVIELDKLRRRVQLIINFVAFGIAVSGLAALVFWLYEVDQTHPLERGGWRQWLELLQTPNKALLFFWIGMLSACFVAYRLSEELRTSPKIRPLKYRQRRNIPKLPSNWQEIRSFKFRHKIDVSRGYSQAAFGVIEQAYLLAQKLGHSQLSATHLFYACLYDSTVAAIFTRLNVDGDKLVDKIKTRLSRIQGQSTNTALSEQVQRIFIEAYLDAYELEMSRVEPMNLLLPCLRNDKYLYEILYDLGVDFDKIYNVVQWFNINKKLVASYHQYRKMARFKPASNMDRAYTAVATPTLDRFSYDLTLAAKWSKLEYCVGREREIEGIFQSFESGKHGAMLVGPPGAGKNTIISGIAQRMVKEDVPLMLQDKRLLELDIARIISGSSPTQAQEKLIVALDEAKRAGNIVIYINDIENIMGISAGGEGSLDLSEVLVNELQRGSLYCLASTTNQGYIKYIEGKPLGNTFAKIEVEEPDKNEAIRIIESKIGALEGRYQVYFSYNAVEMVEKLSRRYIHDRFLPEKAIDLLNLVAVRVNKERGPQSIVTQEDIAKAVSEITKIPVAKISEQESKKLLNLEAEIHKRMVDQEEAVKAVAASLRRARAQLREGKRPIANFLFLGPTGVGKTELAKTVAEIYFGSETTMIRIDMSEFQHAASIEKMIGSPYGIKGHLTEAVRRSPFSLILLDEFEKAHPDILNLFLQVMDDGRLTDGEGRRIDFTNSIIIATSNAGALFIQESIKAGEAVETIKQRLINEVLPKLMRPELINRFDGVIVFKPLTIKEVEQIAALMLNKVGKLLEDKGIGLEINLEGVKKLAQEGFDPKFGARPLRRLLQDTIENQIANKILAGELARRDTVVIDSQAKVQIKKAPPI